jgi:hypothetical protein
VTGNDPSTYTSLGRISSALFNEPGAISLDCSHNTLWVSEDGTGMVTEVGLCPGTVVLQRSIAIWANLPTGSGPNDITYDSHTHAIYITNGYSNSVTSYETDTLTSPFGRGCPQGVVDYGLNGNQKYHYTTTAFESVTAVNSLGVGASSAAAYSGISSLQLNVVDYGVATSIPNGIYWTQDVISLASAGANLPFNHATTPCASPVCIQFTSEIFNFTQPGAGITYTEDGNNVLTYKCNNNGLLGHTTLTDPSTYYCDTQWQQGITLPFTIKLLVITGVEGPGPYDGQPYISFQYLINKGVNANKWIEFDRIHFNNKFTGKTVTGNPLFTVSGAPLKTPDGHFNDAEIVFCGYAGSAAVAFTSIQASMWLLDLNSTAAGFTFVPHAFASGSDTAETVTNVYIKPTAPRGTAYLGGDNTGQLY